MTLLSLQLSLIAILIIINAFFAASEIAIVSVRKTRIRQLAEDGRNPSAWALLRLSDNPGRFLATIQVGVTLAGFFASAVGAVSAVGLLQEVLSAIPLVAEASGLLALAIVTILVAFATLIFGELVPKNLAVTYAERIAIAVARPIDWFASAMTPVVLLLTFTTNSILRLLGSTEKAQIPEVTEDEIRSLVDAGEQEGIVEPIERKMIQGVFDFADTLVREVMVPRVDIVALPKDATPGAALDVFLSAGYSRVPIFDGSLDNIIGILFAKDLLKHYGGFVSITTIVELARPASFVPETKKVSELFSELQHSRVHMAVVVDEYGGTAGIVTLEDLLEEIVGEIHDEYETVEKHLEITNRGEVIASGKTSLDELNEALKLRLEGRGEYETLGGLIYAHLGRIPSPGDTVVIDGLFVTILSVWGRRIRQVRIVREKAA
ncbi:MAG: HlyC/CorC family transporter [Chloroflexi bacterium]|nr:HlyC/CorC family transporter [Chloroflexota bacterium]